VSRFLLKLTPGATAQAHAWLARALSLWSPDGGPWVMELREGKRTDEQNAALWSLLGQIAKQRPTHNGVKMTPDLWKAVFMDAWGAEVVFLPKLDGDGMFPAGHRSSHLTIPEFSELIETILAWTAREGVEIKHFDTDERKAAA
jgi:hypothetical protein